jgi:hypothetical protein
MHLESQRDGTHRVVAITWSSKAKAEKEARERAHRLGLLVTLVGNNDEEEVEVAGPILFIVTPSRVASAFVTLAREATTRRSTTATIARTTWSSTIASSTFFWLVLVLVSLFSN